MSCWQSVRVSIHPAGWPFIAAFAVIAAVLGTVASPLLWLGIAVTLWCAYFFRDPVRVTPVRSGLVTSAADGHVQSIVEVVPPAEIGLGDQPMRRISVFLNVFDVHINRIPVESIIEAKVYHPGMFFNAALDKASQHNERMSLRLRLNDGRAIGVVQIAGLVARRIVCDVNEGKSVKAGERYGMIRFGSRVDIYLPLEVQPLVMVGQYVIGGETVVADLKSSEPARVGEVR